MLAILATVAAFSLPAMARLSRRARLEDAAARVRAELGRARLEAIESGTPRQFRFEPGGRRFEVAPRAVAVGSDSGLFGGFGGADDDDARPRRPADDEPPTDELTQVELDDGICFWLEALGDPPDPESSGDDRDAQAEWSAPIVFYPNGRTLNAHFQLTDGRDYYVDITLRGLTGIATAGPVTLRPKTQSLGEEPL